MKTQPRFDPRPGQFIRKHGVFKQALQYLEQYAAVLLLNNDVMMAECISETLPRHNEEGFVFEQYGVTFYWDRKNLWLICLSRLCLILGASSEFFGSFRCNGIRIDRIFLAKNLSFLSTNKVAALCR